MKLIIAGGRDYHLTRSDIAFLDSLPGIQSVVSGKCRGADSDGERWAQRRGIAVVSYAADWEGYGRRAGPIRNRAMAEIADGVVLFPGGRGTDDMARVAKKAGLTMWDRRKTL